MYVGIVGRRDPDITFEDFCEVIDYHFPDLDNVTFFSGGAKGIDEYAKRYSRMYGVPLVVMRPEWFDHSPHKGEGNRYYRRNELIATASDVIIAFPKYNKNGDYYGGTGNTIDHAYRLGKTVILY